jgi:hypothetical protein
MINALIIDYDDQGVHLKKWGGAEVTAYEPVDHYAGH